MGCTKAWVVLVSHDILRFATKMHVALNREPRDNLHLYVTAVKYYCNSFIASKAMPSEINSATISLYNF